MAKTWIFVLVAIFAVVALVWLGDYWYNYYTTGICRDDYGNSYLCEKSYRYSTYSDYNYVTYSYDNYGNKVVKTYNHDFDDYYDCYHARDITSRYGEILREDYGIRCRGYEVVSDNYQTNYYSSSVSSEQPPIIYVY